MRNESHTRGDRSVLAVSARDNDRVKSQGHRYRANGAYDERVPFIRCKERGNEREDTDKEERERDKSEKADSVNTEV